MILIPAYGRDYTNAERVLKDFNSNMDFILCDPSSPWDGKPINKEQIEKGTQVKVRYQQATKSTIFKCT